MKICYTVIIFLIIALICCLVALKGKNNKSQVAVEDNALGYEIQTEVASVTSLALGGKKDTDLGITDEQYEKIKKEICDEMYPVNSIYTSNSDVDPSTIFGGIWKKIYADYDYIYTGSQVIYDSWSTSSTTKSAVLGTYGSEILNGVFAGLTVPEGYTAKVGATAQFNTSLSNSGKIYLNSKLMSSGGTWSVDTFRVVGKSNLYSLAEIGTEATYQHTWGNGVNLYLQNDGSGTCTIRNVTVHGYFVSNEKQYKWQRTE